MKRAMLCAAAAFAAVAAMSAPSATFAKAGMRDSYAAAVAMAGRPSEAVKLDESRKPAEVLKWLGIRSGQHVADLMSGTGYWAELIGYVVGPKGSVTAYEPEQFYNDVRGKFMWSGIAARSPNVSLVRYPFEAFAPPAKALDAAIINLSYHDMYWQSEKYKIPRADPNAFVSALYAGMKPGGVVGVIDHVGPAGDTRAVVDKLHRIDPATVRADFERAGFKFAGSSTILANPADDHTKGVFDPSIRGKTDRFMMKFVKPR